MIDMIGPIKPAWFYPSWEGSRSDCLSCTSLSPDMECLCDKPSKFPAHPELVFCPWKTTGTAQLSALQMMGEG